jgi:flagellar hook-associated protein 1 FlgK
MSLSSTLANALSGLSANARSSQVVSSNLANALNENYGRREIALGSEGFDRSGGVRILGTTRHVNQALLQDRRAASGQLEIASISSAALEGFSAVVGTSEDVNSVSSHLTRFETALEFAESDPSSSIRLADSVNAAKELANKLNIAESQIQSTRLRTDRSIEKSVNELNGLLEQAATLNRDIVDASINGRDTSGFLDIRQEIFDKIGEMVPVREMAQKHGEVILFTAKGQVLVDRKAASFKFAPSNAVMPHMTGQNGLLGNLTLDGFEFNMMSDSNSMAGGSLQAQFKVRDELSVEAQSYIDGLALELATRFANIPEDTTLTALTPGLFTDDGAVASLADEVGLAGRISINASVDPDNGGEAWRMRSGMNAATENDAGNTSILSGMLATIRNNAAPASAVFSASGTIENFNSDIMSHIGLKASQAEQRMSYVTAQHNQLQELYLEEGVDTDAEIQRLLSIEMNYAANAKIIQAVEEMLDTIMRIG